MSDLVPQSFEKHARYVPGYHFLLLGIVTLNLLWSIRRVIRYPSYDHGTMVAVAIALVLLAWYERAFAVRVQDRVIRLEETLRLHRLAPDLAARAAEFSRAQWVALRFASDEELPALARKALDEPMTDQATIKRMIKTWRPDYFRA